MKKILALVLAMVMCFSLLAACGGKDKPQASGNAGNAGTGTTNTGTGNTPASTAPDPAVKYADTIRLSIPQEPVNGAYYAVTTAVAKWLSRLTHDRLFEYVHETQSLEPVLAEKAEDVNGDGKTWKFTLKQGIKFYDLEGKEYTEFKANDVKYTLEWAAPGGPGATEGAAAQTLAFMKSVEKIEVTGDYELVITLNTALFDFPYYMDAAPILSEKAMTEKGSTDGQEIGTGAYHINYAKTTKGLVWTLSRFEGCFREDIVTNNIELVIQDVNTGVAAMQAGEVHGIFNPGVTAVAQLAADSRFQVHSVPSSDFYFVGFNGYPGGMFENGDKEENVMFRQAVRYAINKDQIVQVLFAVRPEAGSRNDQIVHPMTAGYVEQAADEFNVEKGRELMTKLGYSASNPRHVKLAFSGANSSYAEVLQDQLKEIWVELELVSIESKIFGATLRTGTGWDMVINYNGNNPYMFSMPDSFYGSWGSLAKTYGWNSAKCDELINEVKAQTSAEAQEKKFAEWQTWCKENVPYVMTYVKNVEHVYVAEMEGLVGHPASGSQVFRNLRLPE